MRNKPTQNKLLEAIRKSRLHPMMVGAICTTSVMCAMPSIAQEAEKQEENTSTEVIEVRGIRQTIQDAIAIKRESTEIVDGLSASDIGDLPALSIGEALETLTGASSHREQGGATEISIRGLGPFLGSTVFNGREVTNGSGDRSVNFSQFPSELFDKIAIAKTQSAEYIEGGVAGQIQLETVKPLDYGKRLFQIQAKGNYNPDNAALKIKDQDIGTRFTASYIDQWETDSLGEIGFTIGAQKDDRSNPEQEARTGTTFDACRIDPTTGLGQEGTDCDDDIGTDAEGAPLLFSRSQNSVRQNITDDDRKSIFTTLQWRPSDTLELNLDYEYSDRVFSEVRNDLVFAEVTRLDGFDTNPDGLPGSLIVTDTGSVRQSTTLQRLETNSAFQERLEKYNGGGLEIIWDVNDSLTLSADFANSITARRENIFQTRLRSDPNENFDGDAGVNEDGRVQTRQDVFLDGAIVPVYTLRDFDVSNADNFAAEARTRLDINQDRRNEINSFRTDAEYIPDIEYIRAFKTGFRYSKLEFDSVPRVRNEFTFDDATAAAANLECRNDVFPEGGFLTSETGGSELFTNVDDNGNVIESGTGSAFATFDARCLANNLLASEGLNVDSAFPTITPEERQDIDTVDLQEETYAIYAQADYDTYWGDYGIRGNFGVRVIRTEVESISFRAPLVAVRDETGVITDITSSGDAVQVEGGNDYTEVLPSVNLVVDVSDNVLARAAIYRAISRPDPSELGFGRSFNGVDNDTESTEVADVIGTATAAGNPERDAFTSWNGDVAVEWYANDDTLLAVGAYYKSFEGGFENAEQTEIFDVEGQALATQVSTIQTTDETSTIWGAEVTATHSFSYLDSWLNGFGVKLSYNYANSNFQFEDEDFGDRIGFDDDGNEIDIVGIIPSSNIFGFSRNVLFGQLYYQYEGFSASINYKYRSRYFQQFTNTPGAIRFIDDTEVWEARMSYRLNRNWKFSVEAINIFDEPRRQFRPTRDNPSEVNIYGPRIFAGVVYKY